VLPFAIAVAEWPSGRVLAANGAWRRLAADAGSSSLAELFPKAGLAAEGALQGADAAAAVTLRALPLASAGGDAPTWWDLDMVPHPERAGALVVTAREVTAEVLARRDAEAPATVTCGPPDAEARARQEDDGALRRATEAAGLATFDVEDPGGGGEAIVSPAFRALFGLPPDARCDLATILARVHPDDRGAFLADHARLAEAGGRFAAEFRIVRPDGTTHWIQSIGQAEAGPAAMPRRLRGVNLDVTARKVAEAALAESEAQLRRVQRIGRVGGFEIDLRSGANRRSAEYMRLVGKAAGPAEEQHADWVRRLHPDDREEAERRFLDAVADDAPDTRYVQDYRIVTTAGEVRWIAARAEIERDPATGHALRMVGAHVDVTDLKLAEAAIREREARLQEALRAGRVMAFEWTLATDRVQRAGDAVAILGRPPEHVNEDTGAAYLASLVPADRAGLQEILGALSPQAPTYSTRYRYARPDGRIVWLSETGTARFDAAGRCVQVSGLTRDVTAEVEAQADRAASEARLRLFIERAPAAIAMFDTEMRYLAASCRYLRDYNLDEAAGPDALVGRSHYDVFPGFPEALRAVHRRVLAGETLTGEQDAVTDPTGRTAWARWEMTPWHAADGSIGGALFFSEVTTARIEAEQALRRSEARFRALVEASGPIVFRAEPGTDIVAAPGWTVLTGQPEAALRGDGWLERVHPDDRAAVLAGWRAGLLAVTPVRVCYRVLTRDGAWRWVEAYAVPVRNAAGEILEWVGTVVDIHDRRAAEEEAQRSSQLLRMVIESTPDPVWAKDTEGRIILCNQAAIDLLGAGVRERVIGRGAAELILDPAQAHLVAENDRRILESGRIEQVEEAFGSRIFQSVKAPWREPSGRTIGVVGVSRDVTAARAAEAALRSSEERLRLAQDAGGIGSWEWDLATGALHWSDSCHRLHGTDPSLPLSYEAWRASIHPEDLPRMDAALRDALEGRSPGWDIEFRCTRRSDGALRWIIGRGRVLRDAVTGRALRAVGIGFDVTDRRQAEERLLLLAREVDHRAKNALAVVQAAVRLAPKDDAAAFVRTVEGRVAALARAQVLLTESGWQGAALRIVAEGALAAFLPPDSGGAAGEPTRVRIAGPELRLAAVATQPVSLALHELATNAAKYGALSQPGGSVSLSWQMDRAAGELRLVWHETGGPPVPAAPSRRGFGSRIIVGTVVDQLGGQVTHHWNAEGLRCELTLPAARAIEASVGSMPA